MLFVVFFDVGLGSVIYLGTEKGIEQRHNTHCIVPLRVGDSGVQIKGIKEVGTPLVIHLHSCFHTTRY